MPQINESNLSELVHARTEQLRAALELNEELLAVLKKVRGKVTGNEGQLVEQTLDKVEGMFQEVKLRTVAR